MVGDESNLIIVPCHLAFRDSVGDASVQFNQEVNWVLKDFQKGEASFYPGAINGEQKTFKLFREDPMGNGEQLMAKRLQRNPFGIASDYKIYPGIFI